MEQTSLYHTLTEDRRARIIERLLAWFRLHKRDLPWRGASPYAVWISEIMLQQTQVITVIPYFLRFMERFPSVESLAYAPLDEVLTYWAGLGYYARARNLHRAARMIVERFNGELPGTPAEIVSLPGIGRYTAGAILSIAYNLPFALVDANVIRVLSRLFELRGDPKATENRATIWALAEQLVDTDSPGDFNQGLMELGALLCHPLEPECDRCPLLEDCGAGNSLDPSALPEYPPGRAAVTVTHSAALIRNDKGEYLIVQRPAHGLWGGLWEFPRVVCETGETPQEGAARAAREIVGLEVTVGERISRIKHGVMHYRITLYGFAASLCTPFAPDSPCTSEIPEPKERAEWRWESLDKLDSYAFSSPQALLRTALQKHNFSVSTGLRHPVFDFEMAISPYG